MFKALFHKQMLEIRNMYFRSRKKDANGSYKSAGPERWIMFGILYLILAGSFYALSSLFGMTLMEPEYVWIYFMIMNGIAFLAGVVANLFSASVVLFQAKDNEFLLAMPIPPSKILLARMVSLYLIGLIYESMVLLPAIIYYFLNGNPSFWSANFCILGIFVLGFPVLIFSCLFGWLVSMITAKLKNKSFLTVAISVVFICLFLWFRISANSLFRNLAENARNIGDSVRGWGYPIYALGLGMSGNVLAFLIFTAGTALLFALTCLILSKSFMRIVSVKNESVKAKFSERQIRAGKISSALRRKEFKRFTASPNYMLNCGFGIIFLVAGIVVILIKLGDIRFLYQDMMNTANPMIVKLLPVAGVFAVCLITGLIDIAAPSISLEGSSIWQLQVLPVDPYDVIKAKLFVHVSIAGIPSVLCTGAICLALQTDVFTTICMLLCTAVYIVFSGSAMLALDLKRPMLEWTNENQPIKQSLNVLFSMFGSIILSGILAALYLLIGLLVSPAVYLLICIVIFAVLTVLLHLWFRGRGREIFATL